MCVGKVMVAAPRSVHSDPPSTTHLFPARCHGAEPAGSDKGNGNAMAMQWQWPGMDSAARMAARNVSVSFGVSGEACQHRFGDGAGTAGRETVVEGCECGGLARAVLADPRPVADVEAALIAQGSFGGRRLIKRRPHVRHAIGIEGPRRGRMNGNAYE